MITLHQKTTLTFDLYENDCKFFYAKGNDVELGVLHRYNHTRLQSIRASLFLGERGAWTQEIPVGKFTYTREAEAFLRKLFADKQRLVDVIEAYRAEQNESLDALTQRLT